MPEKDVVIPEEVQDFLTHFGIKGMHWGVRHDRVAKLNEKAAEHEGIAAKHAAVADDLKRQHEDLLTRGIHSEAFGKVYGSDAANMSERQFYFKNGQSKAVALGQTDSNLRLIHNSYARSANKHSAKAAELRAKASTAKHSDVDESPETEANEFEFLTHFGIKGMHWGVRKDRSSSGSDSHVSEDAARAGQHSATARKHGTAALSNEDLQHLVTRLNLERQYSNLTPEEVSRGQRALNGLAGFGGNVAKQQATALANRYAAKKIQDLLEGAAKQQAHRQRNAPLRVVTVK